MIAALILILAALLAYPPAPRGADVETFFGTTVPDPYKALENVDAPQTQAWVKAEGELTRSYLDAIPERLPIRDAFRKLLDYEKLGAPFREGTRWFFYRNAGLQNQSVLYVRDGERAPARVFLDPNRLSKDGTVALAGTSFTHDGRYLAYATESAGSDWQTWHVRDVARDRDLPDVLRWSKFSPAAWEGDRGFYYAAFDAPRGGNPTLAALGAHKLYFHRLGTPQSADRLVYASTAHPDQFVGAETTDDGRYVFFETDKGSGNSLAWKRAGEPATAFRPLFPLDPNVYYAVVDHDGTRLYLQTNAGAPRARLAYVDLRDPRHLLHDLVPQSADKLQWTAMLGDRFYLAYLHDAHTVVRIADRRGTALGTLALPGIGTVGGISAHRRDPVAYYGFASYAFPTTIYRYDVRRERSTLYRKPAIAFDGAPYVTEQLFATSKDGTKVPVFVTHRRDMAYDGSTPTIAYGYGGFDVDETPAFKPSVALWLRMGGAYADVVLRGGGEYGEAWHDAGRLANKQHVFDDFAAALQMLIDRKITSTPKLAINGGSNGGLLVGALLTQHPELVGAAIPQVGVLDMLRFQRWTIGKAWVPEYGSADASREQFDALYAYSPDDHVVDGTHYPPTLIMTSDHDDRVYPAHSFKFAALLQRAQGGDAPVLLRVESNAGHGGGLPTAKAIEQVTDELAFLVKSLGFRPAL